MCSIFGSGARGNHMNAELPILRARAAWAVTKLMIEC